MTMTNTTTSIEAIVNAAAAASRSLPAPDVAPGPALEGAAGIEAAALGAGAKAVSATLTGAVKGTLILTLSAELAALVENGPVGPQELTAGLEPALADATAAIGQGADLRFEAAIALDAEVALANASAHSQVVAVTIAGAIGPVAALVVLIDEEGSQDTSATDTSAASFEALSGVLGAGSSTRAVELLHDVEMGVAAELGRTRMTVRELLSLQPGSVVELDRAAGSPVDLLVNGTLVARGEVVVIDEEFGVRITEIIGYDQKKAGPQ